MRLDTRPWMVTVTKRCTMRMVRVNTGTKTKRTTMRARRMRTKMGTTWEVNRNPGGTPLRLRPRVSPLLSACSPTPRTMTDQAQHLTSLRLLPRQLPYNTTPNPQRIAKSRQRQYLNRAQMCQGQRCRAPLALEVGIGNFPALSLVRPKWLTSACVRMKLLLSRKHPQQTWTAALVPLFRPHGTAPHSKRPTPTPTLKSWISNRHRAKLLQKVFSLNSLASSTWSRRMSGLMTAPATNLGKAMKPQTKTVKAGLVPTLKTSK